MWVDLTWIWFPIASELTEREEVLKRPPLISDRLLFALSSSLGRASPSSFSIHMIIPEILRSYSVQKKDRSYWADTLIAVSGCACKKLCREKYQPCYRPFWYYPTLLNWPTFDEAIFQASAVVASALFKNKEKRLLYRRRRPVLRPSLPVFCQGQNSLVSLSPLQRQNPWNGICSLVHSPGGHKHDENFVKWMEVFLLSPVLAERDK